MKSIMLGLLALAVLAMPARAQPIFPLGVALPIMALRTCLNPEVALAQAKLSEGFGREVFSRERMRTEHEGCRLIVVHTTPREKVQEVPSYMTWMVTYSAESDASFKAQHNGKTYTVPYSFALQRTSWYLADVRDMKDQMFRAWVEVPDKPYMIDYLLNRP
jgi:hypothetical protein